MKKKKPFPKQTSRCYIINVLQQMQPDEITVWSNLKLAVEYLNKSRKLKGTMKISYSQAYRKIREKGEFETFTPSRTTILQRRINSRLNQPHKQLKIPTR